MSPGGFRVSVKSEWRVLLWASILILARHVLVRAPSLPRRMASGIARANQAAGPLGDDAPDTAPWERQPRQGQRRIVSGLLIVGLFSALTVVMTYPQIRGMGTHVAFNDGDALFSAWRLAWVAHQLPRDPLNLFNANIFHPEPRTLALSDAMLVPALMTAPLLWLGVPQLVAYNLVFLASFALSGAAMFLLVRSLTGRAGAALVAGFIFAFLPYRYMHYPHLELQVAQWMPLCLWALHRTVRTGRLRDGLLTGLFLALQALSSLYYGIFLATFMVPVAAALLIGQRASTSRRRSDRLPPAVCSRQSSSSRSFFLTLPFAITSASGRSRRSRSTARRHRTTSRPIRRMSSLDRSLHVSAARSASSSQASWFHSSR